MDNRIHGLPAGYISRPATFDDLEGVVAAINAASVKLIGARLFTVDEFRLEWDLPTFHLDTDTRMVVSPQGQVAGVIEYWDLNETHVRYDLAVAAALWLTPAGVDAKPAKSTQTAKSDSTTRAAAKGADPAPAPAGVHAADKAASQPGAREDTSVPPPDPKAEPRMSMPAGQEGTAFGSLTVEGEDRIRIEFERPALDLKLDPRQSPGLELGDARQILEREQPDWVTRSSRRRRCSAHRTWAGCGWTR